MAHTDPAAERAQLLEALAGWLRTAAETDRLCLLIDDAQWADAETLAVLDHLAQTCGDLPILVLLTVRDADSSGAVTVPLLTGRLADQALRLPLSGLSDDEVDDLLEQVTGAAAAALRAEDDFAHRVRDVAGGNPLFVGEIVRQVLAAEAVDPADASIQPTLPARLHQVIGRRAAGLPGPVRACLEAAAVIGREFEPAVLAAAAGLAPPEVDRCLDIGSRHSLVEEHTVAPLRYRFSHDAVRTALYDGCGPLGRADLHRRVGETLEARSATADSESHHLALGYHYGRASTPALVRRASQHLQRAAELSSDRRAYSAAAQLYLRAESLLGAGASLTQRCELKVARGTVEFYAGIPTFRDTLLEAARDAVQTDQVDLLVRAVVANHRGWYSSTTGTDRERIELIELALLRCPVDDLAALARLNAMWAMENVRDPDQRSLVLERSMRSARIAEEIEDPDLLIDILCDRFSVMYAAFESPVGCVELAERIEGLARISGDEGHLLNAAIAIAQSTMMTGDFATSDEALRRAEILAARVHRPVRLWLARVWIATRTAMRGDLATAEVLAGEALDYGLSLDQPDAFTWYAGQLFSLRYLEGRIEELVDAIEEQVAEHAGAVPAWRAGLAFALATVGRAAEAGRIVEEFTSTDLAVLPHDMVRLQGLAFLASATVALADRAGARVVYDALAPFTTMFAHNGTIDAGPVDLHLGALAIVFEDPALARTHLTAAAAQCEANDANAWRSHVDRLLEALPDTLPDAVPDPVPDIVPPTSMPMKAGIAVLGGFEVVGVDGTVARWTSRKARTLLKYLVSSQGMPVHRETVMHLLWPDVAPEQLTNRFAVALSTVRRALDPSRDLPTDHHIELRDDLLRLDPDRLSIDLDEFHTLAVSHDRSELQRAVDRYRGDPFADELDAEWAVGVRAQAQLAFRQAALRLASIESEHGDHAAAAALFRRVIEIDPFSEVAGRGLAAALSALDEDWH